MRVFRDTRGKSWFDIVPEMDWQVDITTNYPGTVRGFHHHFHKIEWMFVVLGEFKFVLTNPDEIVFLSQGDCLKIDPERWHGYQALGEQFGIMMEISTAKHDLENPDDQRMPWNAFNNWEKEKK